MMCSFKQTAIAGCISMLTVGCASHQNLAPEYRLSSTTTQAVAVASMLQQGRAQLGAGLDALAIESFRTEIRQNPENADAYNGLAVAYDRLGRSDLAQRYFETALAKQPGNAKIQANLAKLNRKPAPDIELGKASVETQPDPLAVTLAADDEASGRILDNVLTPTVAIADFAEQKTLPGAKLEILGKQSALSVRLAAAPVQIATNAANKFSGIRSFGKLPGRKPSDPNPVLPPATILAELRTSGTRLERISLGEVRLVTMIDPPAYPNKPKSNFASFGDRLSLWLPLSIAAEQTTRVQLPEEAPLILAAIQRAQVAYEIAKHDGEGLKGFEQFAYVFFEIDTKIVSA